MILAELTQSGLTPSGLSHQELVELARGVAHRVGLRPRTTIELFDTQAAYDERVGSTDRRWRQGTLHGLCTRGGPGERLIYVNPTGPAPVESLAHELAHAVTPWRQNHSPIWLAVFAGIYQHLEPELVEDAVAGYQVAYCEELT